MLGPYGAGDAGVESIRCRKTVYVPAPYVGLFLSSDLTPVEAWQRLRGAIVDAAAEDACKPIVDWYEPPWSAPDQTPSPYSAAPLCSFLSRTRLFSKRVSRSSTATSLTLSAMRVPAARFMLGSNPGRWLRSSR